MVGLRWFNLFNNHIYIYIYMMFQWFLPMVAPPSIPHHWNAEEQEQQPSNTWLQVAGSRRNWPWTNVNPFLGCISRSRKKDEKLVQLWRKTIRCHLLRANQGLIPHHVCQILTGTIKINHGFGGFPTDSGYKTRKSYLTELCIYILLNQSKSFILHRLKLQVSLCLCCARRTFPTVDPQRNQGPGWPAKVFGIWRTQGRRRSTGVGSGWMVNRYGIW